MSKYRRNEIAYHMQEIEGSRSCHTARHEAANGGSERSLDGPDHRPAHPVRLCNHRIIRDVDPFIVYAYAVMAVLGFPIRVRKSETIRIRTARSLARPEAVKPWLDRGQRRAAVVAGLHGTDECRHENAEGGAEDRDLHTHVRRLIKTPIQITQVVHVSLIVSTPSSPALTFVKAGLANTSISALDRSVRPDCSASVHAPAGATARG